MRKLQWRFRKKRIRKRQSNLSLFFCVVGKRKIIESKKIFGIIESEKIFGIIESEKIFGIIESEKIFGR